MTKPNGRILLTHVGTSLLDADAMMETGKASFRDWRERLKRGEAPDEDEAEKLIPEWGDALAGKLAEIWAHVRGEGEKRGKAPAEIASLQLLRVQPGERVVLVCSGTPDGLLCGKVLERCLNKGTGFVPAGVVVAAVHPIPGIDVRPKSKAGKTFVGDGLPEYMRLVAEEYRHLDQSWEPGDGSPRAYNRLVFNITGGYKGTIPFATLAAQVLNAYPKNQRSGISAEVVYAHRDSADEVRLTPNLPLPWEGERSIRARYEQLISAQKAAGAQATEPLDRAIVSLLDKLDL